MVKSVFFALLVVVEICSLQCNAGEIVNVAICIQAVGNLAS